MAPRTLSRIGRRASSSSGRSIGRRIRPTFVFTAVVLVLIVSFQVFWWTFRSAHAGEAAADSVQRNGPSKKTRGRPDPMKKLLSYYPDEAELRQQRRNPKGGRPATVHVNFTEDALSHHADQMTVKWQRTKKHEPFPVCAYRDIMRDLAVTELYPHAGERHMVDPPVGGNLTLVCCRTTAGPLSILVHERWAPLGAQRFVDMVSSGYMKDSIPLMRCLRGFICQFGIHSVADYNRRKNPQFGRFQHSIEDDPNWLPEGKDFRQNKDGVKRFAKGYMAFAGGGKATRSKQLIVALGDNQFLGGGSPWEVPWGEVVGAESFRTLDNIHTGYGEKGPGQVDLIKYGFTADMKKQFPKLDLIEECRIVDKVAMEVPPERMQAIRRHGVS